MSRQQELLDRLEAAASALHGVDDDDRETSAGSVEFLERVTAYADSIVRQTDGELIPDASVSAIGAHADAIATDPVGVASTSPRVYGDAILAGVALLPPARDREVEQAVRETAANFQRSASQRLNALESETDASAARIRETIEELRAKVEELSTASTADIESRVAAFTTQLTTFETTITAQQARIDALIERETESFGERQTERTESFQAEVDTLRERVEELLEISKTEIDARIAEIRRMEEESSGLVHSIGLGGTAERYGDEAKAQKEVADRYRWMTVLFALGAVASAILAVVHHVNDNSGVLAKLGVSAVLGAVATYTARQSGRHRRREERARNLQLELTAFAPFIEPLPEPIKELERVLMTRKTFGNIAALPDGDGDHSYGPLVPVLEDVQKRLAARFTVDDA